jgi:hypothetical protein
MTQSSFGCGWSITTVQPNSSSITVRQLCTTIEGGVTKTPPTIADA